VSKITELRREATEAIRARHFEGATKLYERICGLDGSNPGYRNELGDIFVKMGNVPSAVENFEKAIELYMAVGLTNNAVAVHKKILRFDPDRLDSHWGLADIRRRQGLDTEASASFLEFLERADGIQERDRDVFLDRCALLIENMPDDLQILSKLEEIYQKWGLAEERARILICKARLAHASGESGVAEHYIARARELVARLDSIPEYADLPAAAHGRHEGGATPAAAPAHAPAPAYASGPAVAQPAAYAPTRGAGGAHISAPAPAPATAHAHVATHAPPPGAADAPTASSRSVPEIAGHDLNFELDLDTRDESGAAPTPSVQLTQELVHQVGTAARQGAPSSAAETASPQRAPAPAAGTPRPEGGGFNLLDEILADGDRGLDLNHTDQQQVHAIVRDLQGQVGSEVAPDDYKGQYDLGLVYMDMALYEQAIAAFDLAAAGDDGRLKALEMKGVCLRRMGRLDDALATYREGLRVAGLPARFYLGLLYEVGNCLEELGRFDEALDYYGRVAALDAGFLDVQKRLTRLQVPR
jgi:tetratricopeptide (TPR) repeat protein